MALETGSFIDDLVITNPVSATDLVRYGAGHLRIIKELLKNSFAGSGGAILVAGADLSAMANTITLTPVPALTEYTTRMLVVWLQAVTNTGATVINISGLGDKAVVSVANAALVPGDLVAGRVYVGVYDGTSVQMLAVTKNYVDQLAFQAAMPLQPGTTVPYVLRTISGVASWGSIGIFDRRGITSADTVGVADIGNLVDFTSGTFTLAFAATATLGDQASGYLQNSGTGVVTLDPSGAEQIDSLTSYPMLPGEVRKWYVEGSALKTIVLHPYSILYGSTDTWTKPPGYSCHGTIGFGGAGGGGSGRRDAAGTARPGGSGGGGGVRVMQIFPASALSATVAVAIGAGGTGGAAQTTNATDGNPGTAGGNTTFGSYLTAYGGGFGAGGTSSNISGGGGGGSGGAGGNGGTAATSGGLPSSATFGGATTASNISTGGAGGVTNGAGGNAESGGGSGAASPTNGTGGFNGGGAIYGGAGGGAGGGISSGNTAAPGGSGGPIGAYATTGGAAGGTTAPTTGTAGTAGNATSGGGGGGGGGSHASAAGGAGGAGGLPAGGGGGGGGSANGASSGAGGNGANGQMLVWGIA